MAVLSFVFFAKVKRLGLIPVACVFKNLALKKSPEGLILFNNNGEGRKGLAKSLDFAKVKRLGSIPVACVFKNLALKKSPEGLIYLIIMAGTTGIEPATSCVTGMHSNQLSYAPIPLILFSYQF